MKLTYLIRNDEVKDRFLAEELPSGITRGAIGIYEAEGGKLYILSFSVEGSTVAGARALSKLRGSLRDDANTRLLVDDASLKFASTLYPRFAEYERKLRAAIILATCAKQDNFDDKLVKSLEELTLEGLGRQLFFDTSFQDKVKCRTRELFTKDEIAGFIAKIREDTVWTQLFSEESLPSVRENYFVLCDVRNKVMHHKFITEKVYDRTRKMLRTAINEIDAYIDKVRSDVTYPKRHAVRAASAAKRIRENYESMFQNLGGSLAQFAATANVAQKLSSQIDTGALASFAAQTAGIQEVINRNREMWESVAQSMTDKLGAIQAPGLTSAINTVNQQSQMQKLISDGTLSSLSSTALSNIDTSTLSRTALPNIEAAFGQLDAFDDDEDVAEGDGFGE